MQHAEAIRSMASEKYLLDELAPELREEFEEHFFDCPECALDVRAGTAFVEHAKAGLAEPAPSKPVAQPQVSPSAQPGWLAWLRPAIAVPVMALLLIVLGYQNFVTLPKAKNELADLRTPQILPSVSLVNARSERVPAIAARPGQSFLLFVDIPAESRFSSYVCELYSPAGTLVSSVPVSADAAKDTLPLQVPSVQSAGKYSLTVSGVTATQDHVVLTRYPFDLQPQP